VEFAEAHGATDTGNYGISSIRFCALGPFSVRNTSISPFDDPRLKKWKGIKSAIEAMLAQPKLSPARRSFLERALIVLPI